jgi:putative glutathione S-transferase
VRDIYEACGASGPGVRFSVPVLYDTASRRIVSNESEDIVRMLNAAFNAHARDAALDLYPEALRGAIDGVNAWVYSDVNNGVYRCGFATSQAAYEAAFAALQLALERVEGILARQRYIAAPVLTEADIRLFQTLIRYDEVYACYFKCNGRLLREMPHTFNYMKELYQMPSIKRSVNMAHIKRHYYASHPSLNVHAIVPVGCAVDYDAPHDRARFK